MCISGTECAGQDGSVLCMTNRVMKSTRAVTVRERVYLSQPSNRLSLKERKPLKIQYSNGQFIARSIPRRKRRYVRLEVIALKEPMDSVH